MVSDAMIRRFGETDSVEELTHLLHRAYRQLAERGLSFMAARQDVAVTRDSIIKSECYVMQDNNCLIGTILFSPPGSLQHCQWYARPDVAVVGKFAVEPELQGRGFGTRLLAYAENRARELGAREVALDTAETATDLIDYYSRNGYREVGKEQWGHTNYRSVVLSKSL